MIGERGGPNWDPLHPVEVEQRDAGIALYVFADGWRCQVTLLEINVADELSGGREDVRQLGAMPTELRLARAYRRIHLARTEAT